jgi:hypothetical protein
MMHPCHIPSEEYLFVGTRYNVVKQGTKSLQQQKKATTTPALHLFLHHHLELFFRDHRDDILVSRIVGRAS